MNSSTDCTEGGDRLSGLIEEFGEGIASRKVALTLLA